MRHSIARRARRGFTLIELLVGMVIFAIVGALFTQLLTVQGRYYDKQGMGNAARNVSRASLNRIVSDFRMIEASGGVIAATPTSLTVRLPYAIGMECADNGGYTHLTLLPVDSTTYANANTSFYGYAWRSSTTGAYTYVDGATLGTGLVAQCTGQQVTPVPNGRTVSVTPVAPIAAGLGTIIFLYTRVRYEFKASTAVPGQLGLYRTLMPQNGAESSEELVAPFANTASWKFIIRNVAGAQTNPPALLNEIRGLELHLDGMSEIRAAGKPSFENAPFTTAVYFKNRVN
ncbi:MAG TPA: prepilin-type N-terminal cleavage/methylation domain-containing protein [Gemmatimonadaceae bacterium]|jgi:prepilin-type N-terminal cleavage/methylation domain-containing protein|nr:prepilin-type N-terminal cleavage/methylation domain-containing protein [Gemmatimonadaceae bacterium]